MWSKTPTRRRARGRKPCRCRAAVPARKSVALGIQALRSGGENPPLTYSRYANVDPASLRGRLMRSPGGAEEEWTRAPQPFFVISRTTARPRRPAGEAERSFSNIEIKTFAAAGC
jgi:hypothetical protein